MTALADAKTAADEAHMTALADAKTAADEAQMTALADAKTAADEAQMTALADAKTAADDAQMTALADAKTAADEAQMTALADAKTAADEAQMTALADAKTAAGEAQMTALADAKTAADEAQVTALADAKTAADAKLMAANDGLVAALQDLDLEPASDTMSVEDQIAANTKTLMDRVVALDSDVAMRIAEAAKTESIERAKAISTALMMPGAAPPVTVASTATGNGISVKSTGFTASAGGTPAVRGEAWNGVTLEKSGASSTERVRIYTTIEEPDDVPLVRSEDGSPNAVEFQVSDGTADLDKWASARPLSGIVDLIKDQVGLGQGNTATVGNQTTVSGATTRRFAGSYRNIPGTFVCSGTCDQVTVTYIKATDDDPEKIALSSGDNNDWYFQPDDLTDTVKVADTEFLYFGSWLETPDKQTGAYTFNVYAGGGGDISSDTTVQRTVIGTASYEGPAAGMYVTKNLIADTAKAGEFTATTTLTANFGDLIPVGLGANMIEGTVKNFMENGQSLGSWSVELNAVDIGQGNWTDGVAGATLGSASKPDAGLWTGRFYGNPSLTAITDGEMTDATAAQKKALAPTGVVGTFNADLDAANIRGAYGATIK